MNQAHRNGAERTYEKVTVTSQASQASQVLAAAHVHAHAHAGAHVGAHRGIRAAVTSLAVVVALVGSASVVAACGSDDDDSSTPGTDAGGGMPDGTTTTPPADAGGGGRDSGSDATTTAADSGTSTPDASGTADTGASDGAADAGMDAAAAPTFCQSQTGLAFCADFDQPNALSLDAGAFDAGSYPGEASDIFDSFANPGKMSLSTVHASSAPDALLFQLGTGNDGIQSVKAVKQVTPVSGVTQAIYELDMYIDQVALSTDPNNTNGGFATDLQFDDNDTFGFRIGVFANTTGFDHADLEHNHPDIGGGDDITSPIALSAGSWQHVKMAVAYSTGSDGGSEVAFQLYLNKSATAAIDATYPAPFARAHYARLAAGMVYAFDPNNHPWGLYFDNVTLKTQ